MDSEGAGALGTPFPAPALELASGQHGGRKKKQGSRASSAKSLDDVPDITAAIEKDAGDMGDESGSRAWLPIRI